MKTDAVALDAKEIDARLGEIDPPVAREVLLDLLAGEISPVIALSRLLLALGWPAEVEAMLAEVAQSWGRPLHPLLYEVARLLQEHREGCEQVSTMLREHPATSVSNSPAEDVIASCRAFFDRAVSRNEMASVAAYSLGDPEILARATREVVDLFEHWDLLGADRKTLEIGCGIGRMQAALAPRVAAAHGLDISPRMIAAAKTRCAGLPNVHFSLGSGRDLAGFEAESLDLVFAVDSFPYIYQAGPALAEAHFHEAVRVLRPGGELVIFNYSYRDDLAGDRHDVRRLARAAGLIVVVAGAQPFTFWDGIAFRLRRA
ncbi:MAG TPA: class I SAM-dependent methyltransferase [Thermoanaerobaculia bacterium]|nr:class I SAM-dependent methyltransferase [Thermoanaerobaculia bacterium]